MNNLEFNEKNHEYFLNKKRIPSVTQILAPISKVLYENIEIATLRNKAKIGSKVHKLIELYSKYGLISKDDEKKLHAISFIGNDAAHYVKAPLKNQVIIALKIIQHLISSKYGMQDEINKYLELPISTYEEFKIMLNKNFRNGILSSTFTLQTLIGKDKRRVDQNNISTFIQQYESEIQDGTNQLLEDVTSQIQASTSNENTITQKIYKIKSN